MLFQKQAAKALVTFAVFLGRKYPSQPARRRGESLKHHQERHLSQISRHKETTLRGQSSGGEHCRNPNRVFVVHSRLNEGLLSRWVPLVKNLHAVRASSRFVLHHICLYKRDTAHVRRWMKAQTLHGLAQNHMQARLSSDHMP